MYQYFFYVNKYRSKEAKRKTGHPGVSKVNAGSVYGHLDTPLQERIKNT